jgi:hypothetical protein
MRNGVEIEVKDMQTSASLSTQRTTISGPLL